MVEALHARSVTRTMSWDRGRPWWCYVAPRGDIDSSDVTVAVVNDLRATARLLPTQVVIDDARTLPDQDRLARRLHSRL